jgi:MFS family permease
VAETNVAARQLNEPVIPQEEPYPSERYAWYVVGVLMVVYIFSFVDRQILALMVGPIQSDLGISDTQMGLLMGPTFAVFYAICGFPLGRLADAKSRRTIIALGLAAWSVMTAGCGMARNYAQLLAFRLGVGVGEASLSPAAYSLITDYFRPARLATALGAYSIGVYVGSGMAFILGAYVYQFALNHDNFVMPMVGEIRPWQLVFFVISVPGLLFTAVLYTIREPARRGIQVKIAGKGVPVSEVIEYMLHNWRTFVCHCVGFSCLSFVGYGSASWVPEFYMRIHEWERTQAGLYYGLGVIVFGTAGVLFGGYFADYLKRRGQADAKMRVGLIAAVLNLPLGIGFVLIPGGTTTLSLPFGPETVSVEHGLVAYYGFMLPSTFTLAMTTGVAAAAIQEMMPNPMRGQASALYLFVVNIIGLGGGPLAVGMCTDYVFGGDKMMLWASLLITGAAAKSVAIPLLYAGLKQFQLSIDRKAAWESANG